MGWTVHRSARGLGNGMGMEMEMEMVDWTGES